MESSKGSSKGQVLVSSVAEGSQTEIFNKRKALGHLKYGSAKGQVSHEGLKIQDNALSGTSGDFPQKKQRLACPQHKCDFTEAYSEEYDFIANEKIYGEILQHLDSAGNAGGSPHCSEASAIDSDYGEPSLTNGSHSPRSITSSRSSSRPPYFGTQSDALFDDVSNAIYEIQSQIMYDEDDAPVATLAKGPSMTGQSVQKSLPYPPRVETGNVAPTTSFDRNSTESEVFDGIQTPQENEYLDQSSFARSASPSNRSHPATSSFSESEDPLTEGDKSSQSQPSSEVSDSGISDGNADGDHGGTLESVIKTVLRTDPEVAELLFRSLEGRLECAPPNHSDRCEESSGLSLLSILELQDSRIVEHSGAVTYAPSSSSSSSSTPPSTHNQGGSISSSSNRRSLSLGVTPVGRGPAPPNEGSGQLVKSQKNNMRSNPSESAKPYYFRCIHNALEPEIFCVNHETQEKFRPCAGPGWKFIQHLKEHMQSHHTKKPNPLQCSRCQGEFKNQDLLKRHEMNVDCPIRCPDCRKEFELKAMRQAHQEETHLETSESRFMEIDDAMDKKIKENLKAYVGSLNKGKGPIDPILERWIEANTDRYMIGRSKPNPKLELGQWYIIFSTLASDAMVLEHPFYDYGYSPSDLAAENILLINERMIDARIEIHGLPPTDIQAQRDWYQDALRESLKLAAKTRLVLPKKAEPSSEQRDTGNPTQLHGTSASRVQGTGYSMPIMTAPHNMTPGYQMTATHEPQVPSMSGHLSGLDLPPSTFAPNFQQQAGIMTTLSTGLPVETSASNSMMTGGIGDIDWSTFQQNMPNGTVQPFDSQSNFEFEEGYNVDFEPPGPDMLGHPQYPTYWQGQQGKQ